MKNNRQSAILQVIGAEEIETQNALMEALRRRGVSSTQATLSRDIKELNLIKELSESGRYRYVLASRDEPRGHSEKLKKIFKESVLTCATAQNIIVLKTLPGLAMAASSALDGMKINSLIGTVAGDDTVFLAMSDVKSAEIFCEEIKELF